jgi:hypothetical protein
MTGVDVSNVNLDVYRFVESRFRGLVKDWTMMVDPNVEPSMCPTDTLEKLLRNQEKGSDFVVTDELLRHGYHAYLNERRAAVHEAMIRYHLISSVLATQGCQREQDDPLRITIYPTSSSLSSSSSLPPRDISIPVINSKCLEFGSLVKVDLIAAIESNFSYLTNHYRYKNSANISSSSSQNIKDIENTNEMISILIFVHCMHLKDKAESNAGFCRYHTQKDPQTGEVIRGAFEPEESAVHLDFKELGYLGKAGHSPQVRSIMMLILCIKNGEYVRFFEVFAALSSSSSPSSHGAASAPSTSGDSSFISNSELSVEDLISQATDDLCAFGAAGGALTGGAVAALSHNSTNQDNITTITSKKTTTTSTGSKIPFVLHKLL